MYFILSLEKSTITTTINRRTYIIPKGKCLIHAILINIQYNYNSYTEHSKNKHFFSPTGLQVCFLTDSMCRDIEDYFPNAQCWVHPDTTLVRSVQQHVKLFEKLHNYTIVILHIGTNDITSGAPASTVVQRMKTLISRISLVNPHILYFAISAILPRLNQDSMMKTTIKECNSLLQHWTSQTRNILFLNTTKPFLKNGKIVQTLYKDDGLHLNQEGKHKLFSYFKRFLWHFCQFS